MPFLTIDGITVPVAATGAQILAPERIGTSARAFDGSLRSTVRTEKRGWQFRTTLREASDWTALEAAVADGAHVDCGGDALGGTVSCEVTLGESSIAAVPGAVRKALTLTLREV